MAHRWFVRLTVATSLGVGVSITAATMVALLPPNVPIAGRARAWLADAVYLDARGVVFQQGPDDCGVSALAMLLHAHARDTSALAALREVVVRQERGLTLLELERAADQSGVDAQSVRATPAGLRHLSLPVVVHFPDHFLVLDRFNADDTVELRDPAVGRVRMTATDFRTHWTGVALVVRGPAHARGT